MDEIFQSPEWLQALTLAERASLPGANEGDPLDPERLERAARKAGRWRNESDLLDDDIFAERLALEGLTPGRFLRLLAEPAADLQRRAGGPPAWLEPLQRAFTQPRPPLPAAFPGDLGLLELLRPLIADACARVLESLRRIAGDAGAFDPETVAGCLLATLLRRLRWLSERTLTLELHVSRLEGKLHGDTPEERFGSFVASLRNPENALEILRRYPVLARDACRHAEQWVETSLEMMERFQADREEIVRLFASGEDPGALTGVRIGLSDRHAGGRSVAILDFASGLRVVYKPKPLAIDLRFQGLVEWLNERGADPPLRSLAILDRGAYGWMEHVSARPCETPDEVRRFHERQGAWVGLFYALEATDFHHENLIAAGEDPVPIDLETLFQPTLPEQTVSGPGSAPMANTVLRSGLLPQRFWADTIHRGLDLTGMGAMRTQTLETAGITEAGTDRMRWA
ncbi:MAG TPA: type 2 lanthipeptide synthetase LanM, partial [Thermoanaerobaculia bacterium]